MPRSIVATLCLFYLFGAASAFCAPPMPPPPLSIHTSIDTRRQQTKAAQRLSAAAAAASTPSAPDFPAFCERCGSNTELRVPTGGDERERYCCSSTDCGFVSYRNPKVVVGAVCEFGEKVLLCRRAIPPRVGKWGYPQGFLEMGETTRQGAARETREEAGSDYDPAESELLAIYNLAGSQVQMIYRVDLASSDSVEAGTESLEARLFGWDDIPWDDLAFPTVRWTLEHARSGERGVLERTKLVDAEGNWSVREG